MAKETGFDSQQDQQILQSVQAGSDDQLASKPVGTEVSFSWGKAAGEWICQLATIECLI
jgi:hypothetical protein